ncbi:MAG: hypothetical protein E6501_29685, partial [Bradyrhizobium sp.]|nr:hypothetical protein [Bradyrhizobium sp.]
RRRASANSNQIPDGTDQNSISIKQFKAVEADTALLFFRDVPIDLVDRRQRGETTMAMISGRTRRANHAHPKVSCQRIPKNINRFASPPNQPYGPSIPLHGRGRFAVVTDVGSGMRWTRAGGVRSAQANAGLADGQGAWS